MIIWRGQGFLPLVLIVMSFCMALLPVSKNLHSYLVGACLVISAFITWILGKHLNGVVDQKIGTPKGWHKFFEHGFFEESKGEAFSEVMQEVERGQGHSLYYVRMEYWAIPMLIAGVIVVILG